MRFNRSFLPISLAVFDLALAGCASLAPDGAYNGNTNLYDADLIANSAADTFKAFVTWEHQNRATLAVVPAIRTLSDQVNLNSKQWLKSYFAVRDAYVAAAPADKSKYNLANALAPIQAALSQVAIYMAKQPTAPLPVATPAG